MFRGLVHERTGIWLHDGKQVMLASRLSKRLRYHGLSSFADYYAYIQGAPDTSEEICELINCVTTNKTSFFREHHHFDFLSKTVVPQIQSKSLSGIARTIRIWSAACSTGEEAYSIAMTLLDSLQASNNFKTGPLPQSTQTRTEHIGSPMNSASWKIEIVASDIDTAVLATAKRAIYRQDSLTAVDVALQRKYFLLGKDDMQGYVKVKENLTRLIEFKRINLMDARWPLDGLYDAIFFRNALIYFNQKTQDMFLRKMSRYLKPGGYLFLGNAENIPWMRDLFTPLNQTMYQLRDVR